MKFIRLFNLISTSIISNKFHGSCQNLPKLQASKFFEWELYKLLLLMDDQWEKIVNHSCFNCFKKKQLAFFIKDTQKGSKEQKHWLERKGF